MGVRGERVVKAVFGGSLYQQGRGFYVPLELLAILRGSWLLEQQSADAVIRVLPPVTQRATFLRPTHDFARRLMSGWFDRESKTSSERHLQKDAAETLRALLIGLHAPVPGRRSEPADWRKWHLYPYPPDFIHYDALRRGSRISIERDSYRGGGGLAHRILREDRDDSRLAETREAFRQLLTDSKSPLAALARALHEKDNARGDALRAWEDTVEWESVVLYSPWVEQLREGVHRIVTRPKIPDFKRIEALMYWVPYCLVRHQQSLAYNRLTGNSGMRMTVFDCQSENNPIRERARRDFIESSQAVPEALKLEAEDQGRYELLEGGQGWLTSPRTFFTTTAFAVGAANAPSGIRWFTLKPELAEAIVLAKVETPVPFEKFCTTVLFDALGMVVDRQSAQRSGIFYIDQSTFERNSEALAETLHDMGLLERYSDMTRMVGVQS